MGHQIDLEYVQGNPGEMSSLASRRSLGLYSRATVASWPIEGIFHRDRVLE